MLPNLLKNISIFDAIIHACVTWNGITPETIQNCFRKSGVYDFNQQDQPALAQPVDDNGDEDFVKYFQELLNVLWDEYLAMETGLECKEPARAPNAQSYQLDIDEESTPPPTPTPVITSDEALELISKLQLYTPGDQNLFDLVAQLHAGVQSRKICDAITSKTKQCTLTDFFTF